MAAHTPRQSPQPWLRWAAPAAVATACLALGSCLSERRAAQPTEPPLGRWPLSELTGEIRSQSGGKPVLCMQGNLLRLPAALYDGPKERRSWVELRDGNHLVFAFHFEDGRHYDVVANDGGRRSDGFLGEAFGRGAWRQSASWSWEMRELEASVESFVPETVEDSHSARFVLRGAFSSPTSLEGDWSYESRSESAPCWARSRGAGTWTAAAP